MIRSATARRSSMAQLDSSSAASQATSGSSRRTSRPMRFATAIARSSRSLIPTQAIRRNFPTGTNPYPGLPSSPHDNSQLPSARIRLSPSIRLSLAVLHPVELRIPAAVRQDLAVSAYYVGSLNRKTPLYNDINGPQFNITAASTRRKLHGQGPGLRLCQHEQHCQ